jgi:hypothetical protein
LLANIPDGYLTAGEARGEAATTAFKQPDQLVARIYKLETWEQVEQGMAATTALKQA